MSFLAGSCWRRSRFFYICIVKVTHTIYLHECLSTVINTVLSVQVYYYNRKNTIRKRPRITTRSSHNKLISSIDAPRAILRKYIFPVCLL